MRKLKRLAPIMMASTMMVGLLGMNASAVDNTAVSGNKNYSLKKYLVMSEDANVPNATFTYNVTEGDAAKATSTTPEILAGIDADKITMASTTFAVGDDTYDEVGTDDVTVTLSDNQKYAKETATVDFSEVSFKHPGIYRYEITEADTSEAGITKDSSTIYMLVSVTSDDNGTLSVTSVVFQNADGKKTDGFVNTYTTENINLKKVVSGNQADRAKYFEFILAITGADAGAKYDVDLTNASHASNPLTITVGSDGTISTKFYLKHNEYVTIKGLTVDTKYTVTEEDYSELGYVTTNNIQENSTTTGETTVEANNDVTFTNTKQVNTPTGVITTFAPYIIMVALAAVVAFFFLRRRRTSF